ncbi:MAG: type II toxin-antitoxin system VapC family toxin [Burkholderiaceae bacterium]
MPSASEFLLDTHAWVWLLDGESRRIGPRARRLLNVAARSGGLRVSPVSAWEIGMLVRKRRLQFGVACGEWIARACRAPGISVTPLTPDAAAESSFLPGEFHGDPADRMLVACARGCDAVLVTADDEILEYAKLGHVRAIDCRR